MGDTGDTIQVRFKTELVQGDILAQVGKLADEIGKKLSAGLKDLSKADFMSGLVNGLNSIKTASEGVDKQVKATGQTMQRDMKQAQTDAAELNKIIKNGGDAYASAFINANKALDGLHIADFTDVMKELNRQFDFMETKPGLAKQIGEAKTMNEMIAQLYNTIARLNSQSGSKMGLAEMEAGLLEALRQTGSMAAEVLGTERAHEAVLARNVALQAEQNLLLNQQRAELSSLASIDAERAQSMTRTMGVYNQLAILQSKLNMLGSTANMPAIASAMDRLLPLYESISAIQTVLLRDDQQIALANRDLMGYKNQVLEVCNKIGISYEKELTDSDTILRLHQLKLRTLEASVPVMQQLLTMASKYLAPGQTSTLQTMPNYGAGGLFPNTAGTDSVMSRLPVVMAEVEAAMRTMYQTWGQITDSMKAPLHIALQNEIDVAQIKIEKLMLSYEELKRIGYEGGGAAGWGSGMGGGGTPPPSSAAPKFNPQDWNAYNESIAKLTLEANKLYQALQEIATMKVVKGDMFDEVTARVKALEAEIDRTVGLLSKLNVHDISGTDKLAMNIASVSAEAQQLQAQLAGTTKAEIELNAAFKAGEIPATEYERILQGIGMNQETLRAKSRELQLVLQGLFKEVQAAKLQAQLTTLGAEFSANDAKIKSLGASALDLKLKLELLGRQMQINLELARASGTVTQGQIDTHSKLSAQHKEGAQALQKLDGAATSYGMTMKKLITWQLEWYLGAGLIWGAFFKIKDAISEFLSYSQGLTDVGAITGATTEELRKMDIVVRDLATHSTMGFKAAADALKIMGQAGMSAADSMIALPTIAMLTTATGASAADTVKLLTTAMNVWNIEAKDATRIGNAMAAALNYSKLEIGDLAVAFNYLAPQAKLMGTTMEETLGIVAQMSQMGIKASTIGTGISGFMSKLLAPTQKFKDSLATVGLSMKSLTDGDGRLLSFIDIIRKLEHAGMDVATVFEGLEQRQARSLATALTAGAASFEYMTNAVGGTQAMQVMFDKSMEGTLNRLKMLGNQAQDVAIQIGNFLTPAFGSVLTVLKELLTTFSDFGPIILFAGALALLPPAIKGVIAAFTFLAGGPVGWTIAGLTALVGVVTAVRYAFDDSRKAIEEYKAALSKSQEGTKTASDIQGLLGIMRSVNVTDEQKLIALEKLRKLLPDVNILQGEAKRVIAELSQETSNYTKEINRNTDSKITNSLVDTVKGAAKSFEQYRKMKAELEAVQSNTNPLSTTNSGMVSSMMDVALGGGAGSTASKAGIEAQAAAVEKLTAAMKKLPIPEIKTQLANANAVMRQSVYDTLDLTGATKILTAEDKKDIELEAARIQVEKDRLRAKTAPEKPKKDPAHYSGLINAEKSYGKDLVAEQKALEAIAFENLETAHKKNLMSDEQYYESRITIALDYYSRIAKEIDAAEKQVMDDYRAQAADPKNKSKNDQAVIAAKTKTAAENYTRQRLDNDKNLNKQIEDSDMQLYLNRQKIAAESNKFVLALDKVGLDEQLAINKDAIATKEKDAQEAFNRGKITQNALLHLQLKLANDTLAIDLEYARNKMAIDIAAEDFAISQLDAADEKIKVHADNKLLIERNYLEAVVKANLDGAQKVADINRKVVKSFSEGMTEGFDEYMKSLEMNATKGKSIAAEMARSIEDALVTMFDNPKKAITDLGTAFMNQLKRMAAQALMNPIMVQIQGVMTSMVSGIGGAMTSGANSLLGSAGGSLFGSSGLSGLFAPNTVGTINEYGQWGADSGGALGGLSSVLPYVGGAAGLYGMYSAYKSGNAFSGALSGAMGGASIGSLFGPGGTVIGGIIGGITGLISGLLGGGNKPKIDFSYTPDAAWQTAAVPIGNVTTADQGRIGVHGRGVDDATANALAPQIATFRQTLLDAWTQIGADVSGFTKVWDFEFDADGMTADQLTAKIQEGLSAYAQFATGLDFTKLATAGETLSDTVTRIFTSIQTIENFKGVDIQAAADAIDINPDTLKQALDKVHAALDTAITDTIGKTGKDFTDALGVVAADLTSELDAATQYITYIKGLQASLVGDTGLLTQQLQKYALDGMTLMQKIAKYGNDIAGERTALDAATDPTKIDAIVKSLSGSIDALYSALQTLKSAVDTLATAAKAAIEAIFVGNMTAGQKTAYETGNVNKDYAAYSSAKAIGDTEGMASLGTTLLASINTLYTSLMALKTAVEAVGTSAEAEVSKIVTGWQTATEQAQELYDKGLADYDKYMAAKAAGDTDAMAALGTTLIASIDAYYSSLMTLKTAVEAVGKSADDAITNIMGGFLTETQKFSNQGRKALGDYSAYLVAKANGDKNAMQTLGAVLITSISDLYNALMTLKNNLKAVGEAATASVTDKKFELLSDPEKVDYVNNLISGKGGYTDQYHTAKTGYEASLAVINDAGSTQAEKDQAKIDAAAFAEDMGKFGTLINTWVDKGWGLTGVDKAASLANFSPIQGEIATDMPKIADDIDTIIKRDLIPALTTVSTDMTTLGSGIKTELDTILVPALTQVGTDMKDAAGALGKTIDTTLVPKLTEVNTDMGKASGDIATSMGQLSKDLTDLSTEINEKLVKAITDEITALDALKEKLGKISITGGLQISVAGPAGTTITPIAPTTGTADGSWISPFASLLPATPDATTYQAAGGFFTRPTRILNQLIGEAGPEYNLPEKRLIDLVQKAVAGGGPGQPITIILEGDAGPIIKQAKTEGANEAIRIIRRDPRILRTPK